MEKSWAAASFEGDEVSLEAVPVQAAPPQVVRFHGKKDIDNAFPGFHHPDSDNLIFEEQSSMSKDL